MELVSKRLTRLSLGDNGAVPRGPMTTAAIQAALLVDLVIAGAVSSAPTGLFLDTTPTGFLPADRLLSAVVEQPDRPVEFWLRRGPVRMNDMIKVLVEEQIWRRDLRLSGRRYRDLSISTAEADWARVFTALDGPPDTEATAALTVIGTTSGMFGFAESTSVEIALAGSGSLRWIVSDLHDYLIALRAFLSAAAEVGPSSGDDG